MSDVTIVCANNGPLRISGKIILKDADGNEFDLCGRETLAFCRCGLSNNKPLCDGTHREQFQSELQARPLPLPTQKA